MTASAHRIKPYAHADIIRIAKRAKRNPASITHAELRALALFVREETAEGN